MLLKYYWSPRDKVIYFRDNFTKARHSNTLGDYQSAYFSKDTISPDPEKFLTHPKNPWPRGYHLRYDSPKENVKVSIYLFSDPTQDTFKLFVVQDPYIQFCHMDIQGVCTKTSKTSRMKGYDTWAANWVQFCGRTLIVQPNYKLYLFQIVLKSSYRKKTNPQIKLLTKINLPKIFNRENLV
jgi:hypothetical protein